MTGASHIAVISGGGTGGHVFPGLAMARAFSDAGFRVVWLGTARGLEAKLVPGAGFELVELNIAGIRGKNWLRWLGAPVVVFYAVLQALVAMWPLRPSVVLGMGGYVAAPTGVAAWLLRVPLVIHEQNAVPGLTNRMLARLATRVLEAFAGSFPPSPRVLHTGNPVRAVLSTVESPEQRMAARGGAVRILVLGGSQGAQTLNLNVPLALGEVIRLWEGQAGEEQVREGQELAHPTPACMSEAVDVWHQSGEAQREETASRYAAENVPVRVDAFIDDMRAAYEWADLVVCRAGALTLAELATVGVASVLVPYPHAVDNHQSRNAAWLVDARGAVVIDQGELAERLSKTLTELIGDRSRLLRMAQAAQAVAVPHATQQVLDACLAVARTLPPARHASGRSHSDGGDSGGMNHG